MTEMKPLIFQDAKSKPKMSGKVFLAGINVESGGTGGLEADL